MISVSSVTSAAIWTSGISFSASQFDWLQVHDDFGWILSHGNLGWQLLMASCSSMFPSSLLPSEGSRLQLAGASLPALTQPWSPLVLLSQVFGFSYFSAFFSGTSRCQPEHVMMSNDSQYLSSFLLASNPTILVILLWLATFFSDPRCFHVQAHQAHLRFGTYGRSHLPPLSSLPSSLSLSHLILSCLLLLATLIFLPLFPAI